MLESWGGENKTNWYYCIDYLPSYPKGILNYKNYTSPVKLEIFVSNLIVCCDDFLIHYSNSRHSSCHLWSIHSDAGCSVSFPPRATYTLFLTWSERDILLTPVWCGIWGEKLYAAPKAFVVFWLPESPTTKFHVTTIFCCTVESTYKEGRLVFLKDCAEICLLFLFSWRWE